MRAIGQLSTSTPPKQKQKLTSPTPKKKDIKDGKGPISNLYMNDQTPIPTPTASQALIKIKAFGLNRMDLLQREGHYPLPPQAPSTLGVEFSGQIHSVSPSNREGFAPGDAVFGLAYGGAYAEYIAVSTHMLIRKPEHLSWEECAGIPETWMTATQAMYLIGDFSEKQSPTILWHAGASAVSIAGIQLSRMNGASQIFATARSDEKCRFCVEELGATAAFNTTTSTTKEKGEGKGKEEEEEEEHWVDSIKKATGGKGVDIIIDFIGPGTFAANLEVAAKDGRIVNLATLGGLYLPPSSSSPLSSSGKYQTPNFGTFVAKRLRYEGSSLRSRDEEYQGRLRDSVVEHALPMFAEGKLKVFVERVFSWKDIREAHAQMEKNLTKGKLICVVD